MDTPSKEGTLATAVKIRKAHTPLGIDCIDLLRHAQYLLYKVLQSGTDL